MKFEVPSYTADLFGPKYATVIYGRMMTGWSITAILTPQMLAALGAVFALAGVGALGTGLLALRGIQKMTV